MAKLKLRRLFGNQHVIHSFDHVAINDQVVTCDITRLPLEDGALDVAVFCLSLMGNNFTDYLREAHRTLRLDGQLQVYEATQRFGDRDSFVAGLKALGFDQFAIEERGPFTYIRCLKASAASDKDVVLAFAGRGQYMALSGQFAQPGYAGDSLSVMHYL